MISLSPIATVILLSFVGGIVGGVLTLYLRALIARMRRTRAARRVSYFHPSNQPPPYPIGLDVEDEMRRSAAIEHMRETQRPRGAP